MAVTVVVPVYNQAYPLALTLFALTRQVMSRDQFHVVVVDDGSADPASAVVEAYRDRLNIEYVRLPRSGRAAARNAGARWAGGGGLLVFCDADRLPRPGFLDAHRQAHAANRKASVVVGQVREMYVREPERNRERVLDRYASEAHDRIPQYCRLVYSLYDSQGRTMSPIAWVSTLSGNLSLPVDLFWELQGFDERFDEWGFEHMEFGYRARLAGIPFRYARDAVNVHLAHPRGGGSYETHIRRSHALFAAKHRSPAVERFLAFMLGEASLRELERAAGGVDPEREAPELYVKITNFGA